MEPLKTGVRADQNPTVPTEEEKQWLKKQSGKQAQALDGKPGFSEAESKILDMLVEGIGSVAYSYSRPVTQARYLISYKKDIRVYIQALNKLVPAAKTPLKQVQNWLEKQGMYAPVSSEEWAVTREEILLTVADDWMEELKAKVDAIKEWEAAMQGAATDSAAQAPESSRAGQNMSAVINTTSLPDQNGQMTDLSQYFNQPGKDLVLVSLWGTWCGPCKAEIPYLNNVAKKYPNVTVVGLAQEYSQENLQAGVKRLKAKPDYPVLLDAIGEAKAKLAPQAQGIPHLMFFSNDGTLLKEETGFSAPSGGGNPIAGEVEGLLKEGREVPVDEAE